MFGGGEQRPFAQIGMRVGLVRVDPDAGPDVAFARGGGDHALPLALPGRDVEEALHPRRTGARQHALLILDQALIFKVTMTVDQHQAASSAGMSSLGKTGEGLSTRIAPSAGSSASAA